MARLIIECPLLDGESLIGQLFPNVESETDPVARKALIASVRKDILAGFVNSLTALAACDPAVKGFAQEGLFVRLDDDSEPLAGKLKRVERELNSKDDVRIAFAQQDARECDSMVQIIPPEKEGRCYACKRPATGFQARLTCNGCGAGAAKIDPAAKAANA